MVPRARWGFLLSAMAVVLLQGCQPVDEADLASGEGGADGVAQRAGPGDLETLGEAVAPIAEEWDAGATLIEVAVTLDEDQEWREATATFLAPDADRMLVVSVAEEGTTEQNPTLETLGFTPVPAEALDEVPALPDTAVEPGEAAEEASEQFSDCDIEGPPREVLYSSGAPGAWDGSAWAPTPSWSVSALGEGGGVRLNLNGRTGEAPCFAVP